VKDRAEPPPASDEAYTAFVEEAWRRHMGLAILLTHDQGQAEELLQDSLVKVYQRWRRLSRHDDLHAYLRRVLINGQTSVWRRRRREDLVPQIPETACASPAGYDYSETELVAAALWVLPPRQRAVVILRHYEDLPEREVARILGCTLGTVKSQHAKAIAKLRVLLDSEELDTEEVDRDGYRVSSG
jgi:RNA polymerase sigma-70 factor (sigma-E family)